MVRIQLGPPDWSVGRTFVGTFRIDIKKPQKPRKSYGNPLIRALQWDKELRTGKYKTQAEIAKANGVTGANVNQVLGLLKLDPKVLKRLIDLGPEIEKPFISRTKLLKIRSLPPARQVDIVESWLREKGL